jgi:hypothetical protein
MSYDQNKYIYEHKIKLQEPAGVVTELAGGRVGSSHYLSSSQQQNVARPQHSYLTDAAL